MEPFQAFHFVVTRANSLHTILFSGPLPVPGQRASFTPPALTEHAAGLQEYAQE